ncbi:MAG: MBOAT family O-acyltransferase [Dehalococcoidia bacterium]
MLFPTVDFAIFFTAVLAIYWPLRRWPLAWRLFVVGASYSFYAYWDARFCLLLAASTLGNWLLGRVIHRAMPGSLPTRRSRLGLGAGVALNLALLGWFKYYGFFATEVKNGLADLGLDLPVPLLAIGLPIGISFFTFQGISYLVDIHRGQIEKPMKLLDFTVFQSFFPHLVAGPIVRASELGPQIARPLTAREVNTTLAFTLIFTGLVKKVVISSFLAERIVDPVFAVPGEHSSLEILLAVYAYAIQIYADFSGYTDIAIGCALLLGFRFPQNFDAPYRALSLQDFWRRWHMTLSRWLRDYLYIGLGGNRGSRLFTARNLMITMVLGGLWHGAAWTFVAWGAIHGLGLVIERMVPALRPASGRTASRLTARDVVRWLITFHIVCAAWVFFRAESFGLALDVFEGAFTRWEAAPLVTPLVLVTVFGALALQFLPRDLHVRWQAGFSRVAPLGQAACLAVGLVFIDALGPEGVAPFIYFRF